MLCEFLIAKSIAPKVRIRVSHKSNCAFSESENRIYLNPTDMRRDDFGFLNHIIKKHHFSPARSISMGLWTILHEVGHSETIDSEDDLNARAICAAIPWEEAEKDESIQAIYYDIPSEFDATEWAIDWVLSHPVLRTIYSFILR